MSDSKRIIKNSIFLYGRKFISIVAAIYSIRFVLQNLGIEDYGIYSLLGGLIAMLAFFNNAMISSTQRHLSFSMGKGLADEVNSVFNASVQIHFLISVLIFILCESLGLILVKTILDIPEDRMNAAIWVYQFIVFIVVTDVLSVPFQAITNAKEDMEAIAIRDIAHSLGKLLIAIVLGWVFVDRLILYGALMLSLNIAVAFSFYWFCKSKH